MLRLREIETEKSDKFLGKTSFWEKREKTKRRVREKVVEINRLILGSIILKKFNMIVVKF